MNYFVRRRLVGGAWVLLASIVLVVVDIMGRDRLYFTTYLSGWVLSGMILGLTALNLRKKLSVLPLGSVSVWLQVHIYAGWFSMVAFWVHARTLYPDGKLELALVVFFVLVTGSGVFGLVLSRLMPYRLTQHGENVFFERIPGFRARLYGEVEELVLQAASEHGSVVIPEFYTRQLRIFFSTPGNIWRHVWGGGNTVHGILARMTALERYLSQGERQIMEQIAERVKAKDDLDYQYAAQGMLKGWLFVHIPLTSGLIGLAASHAVLAYAFSGAG